jgi:lipopolysaccharide/colanic/teichoic acid biosynthesis glycosyltransferase
MKLLIKRIFDLSCVLGTALLWLPVMGGLYFVVRSRLGAPVFFRQVRPGRGGRAFELIKFRTMTNGRDADGQLLPDAERMTRFGNFLRSSSLDELPELINVLRGEMSLVGPRPLLMQYMELYTPEQARRHDVLPGITGWAQVKGRNALTWDEKFRYDLEYVDRHNLWMDVRILWMTLSAVLIRKGISADGHATMPMFTGQK